MPHTKYIWQKSAAFLTVTLLLAAAFLYQLTRERRQQTVHSTETPARVASARTATRVRQTSFVGAAQFSISGEAYIPVAGALRKREISRSVMDEQKRYSGDRTPLLNEVIRLSPKYFPPDARVISDRHSSESPDRFLINLNRAFVNPQFWRGRNRHNSLLAFHALARNVAFMNMPKGPALPVQFIIEGKQVAKIGAFAAGRPLRPDKIIRGS